MRRLLHHPFVKRHLSLAAILRALRQPLFLTALAISLGLWGFAELADAIDEQGTQQFDEAVLKALREPERPNELIGPAWFEQSLRDITALGGETVLMLLTAIVCLYLTLCGRHDLSLFTCLAVVGGTIVTFALKDVFDRPRPQLVPHILVTVSSGSFPSGHATASAIVYLTLGAMLTESAPNWRLKAYVMGVAVALTLLIGSTRVFLGVHYPTDVLAGWALGFVWAYGCRSVVRLAHFLLSLRRVKNDPVLAPKIAAAKASEGERA
ncbi:MAG: phosphatase PAP2 family protein [Planctomycetota bacterium]|nr:phosphatase PAP2 family protein [Planctomycetota bacterium]